MDRFPWKQLRAQLAVCAALAAVLICALRRHVHIVLADPRTYTSPFHHKCGLLMMVCVLWAVTEVGLGHLAMQPRGHGSPPAFPGNQHES